MTEPRHEQPADPQLSRLYREHALDEPSAELDRQILAAARQAAAPRPPSAHRSGWSQRWRLPLTLATTLMLTVSLALLVERQPADFSTLSGSAKSAAEAPPQPSAESTSSTNSTSATNSAAPAPAAKPAQTPAAPMNASRAEAGRSASDASRSPNSAADQAPASNAERQPPPASAAGEAKEPTISGALRAAPAPAAAPPLTKSRADSARLPAVWLEEIRALHTAGQLEEAERQLREFRLAYPDYLLPEEFRR